MTAPTLKDYDLILVNSSSGKDSQTLLHYVSQVASIEGVEDRIVVVHCDLGKVEWPGARELAEEQADRYGYRFEVVKRPYGNLLDHVRQRGMWPSPKCRYCTSDHKRAQVQTLITSLSREIRATKESARILNCMGMRAQESPGRKKLPEFESNARSSTKVLNSGLQRRRVDNWLGIHKWTHGEVWDSIRRSGVKHHWAYDKGMPRLSCSFCFYAPFAALVIAGRERPDLLDEHIQIEEEIGHTFKHNFSLSEVRDFIESGEQIDETELQKEWNM